MSHALFKGDSRVVLVAASISAVSLLAVALFVAGIGSSSSGRRRSSPKKGKRGGKRPRKIFVRGLYNLGNTCFLNSTLQSLAASKYFQDYLDECLECMATDDNAYCDTTNWNIINQLKNIMKELSPRETKPAAHSPRTLISSLSKKGRWVSSMSEQDAHELFQLISSTLQASKKEPNNTLFDSEFLTKNMPLESSVITVSNSSNRTSPKECSADGPPAEDGSESTCIGDMSTSNVTHPTSPLTGMAASRIACVKCGYTAAIRHFTFDNLSLAVPRVQTTTIESCLGVYTVIDKLDDFKCRRCTLSATLRKIASDITEQKAVLEEIKEASKRYKRTEKAIALLNDNQRRIKSALSNNPEMELPGIELVSPPPGISTKQTMIARPPKVLVLHLSRSIFLPTGDMIKNPAHVKLQPVLDISSFSTTGHISTNASQPISSSLSPSSNQFRSFAELKEAMKNKCLFRLCAVVVHAGTHHSGHFYAYRRVSNSTDLSDKESKESLLDPGRWLQLSDIDCTEVAADTVFNAGNAYMLFYERL